MNDHIKHANVFRKLADLLETKTAKLNSITYNQTRDFVEEIVSAVQLGRYIKFPPETKLTVEFSLPFDDIEAINTYKEILKELAE